MNTMIITNDIRDILLLISECVNIFCVEGVGNLFMCERESEKNCNFIIEKKNEVW